MGSILNTICTKWGQETHQHHKYERCKLSEENHAWAIRATSWGWALSLLIMPPLRLLLLSRVAKDITTKEHIEDVFWVDLILELRLSKSSSTSAWRLRVVAGFFACEIVYFSFLFVGETCICRTDFLESFWSLRRMIFIWMQLDCVFLICFLDIILSTWLLKTKNIIIVLLAKDFTAEFNLDRGILRSFGLFLRLVLRRLRCRFSPNFVISIASTHGV